MNTQQVLDRLKTIHNEATPVEILAMNAYHEMDMGRFCYQEDFERVFIENHFKKLNAKLTLLGTTVERIRKLEVLEFENPLHYQTEIRNIINVLHRELRD
jgi:hypothetical protein